MERGKEVDIRDGIGIKGGFHGVYVVNDGTKEDAAMPRLYKTFT